MLGEYRTQGSYALMQITVNDGDVRRLLARLESGEPAKAGLKAMGGYLRGKLRAYPPKRGAGPSRASVYGQPFVSEKQRRWFFAALKDGSLSLPYRRSSHLAKRWGQSEEDGGWTQVVGNDATYAPWVVGNESQSLYMKAMGWSTTADVVEREADAAFRTFVTGFRQAMQGRG